jgi:glyoxylase-like metal-dependent hydrolase (beta-lactamase superfamily II)
MTNYARRRTSATLLRLASIRATHLIEGNELSKGVWLLRNTGTGHNMGVLLTPAGAVVVDPGALPVEVNALHAFLEENNSTGVLAFVFTADPPDGTEAPGPSYPEAVRITPGTEGQLPDTPVRWETVPLYGGTRLGVYSKRERILFCGDMLIQASIPTLTNGAETYLETLEQVEALDAKMLVPAIGMPALGKREVRARIEQDRNYTFSLVRHVVTSLAARVSLDRVTQVAAEVYEDSPYLQAHLANLRLVWQDMSR